MADPTERSAERDLIFPAPLFHEKIWGGRRLADDFGFDIPDGPVGECWAISAHPNGDCAVRGGAWDGRRLSELWDLRRDLFGNVEGDRFPLLVKLIDAAQDLSVQVHPDDAYAAAHEGGSLGKRECWYVLATKPGAQIVVGQHARSRAEFEGLVSQERWEELLNCIPIQEGDFFPIEPGTVHAICGGTLVLEVQQSSDITYRLYDYNRLGLDGKPRELHLAKAADVCDYNARPPLSGEVAAIEHDGVTRLMECQSFVVERIRTSDETALPEKWPFLCACVVSGGGYVGCENAGRSHEVERGACFIAPSGCGKVEIKGRMELIVSYLP